MTGLVKTRGTGEKRKTFRFFPFTLILLMSVIFISSYSAFAGVAGSPHDFSETGQSYNRIPGIAPAGVCSGCHKPHGAQDFALWARSLAEERSKLKADGTTGPNYLGAPTLNCYDCHEHDSISNSLDNDPVKNDYSPSHRPPNIAFGMKNGTPGNGDWVSDPPGGEVAGYYENDPPNNSPNVDTTNYGVYTGPIPPDNTGGHYFKTADPATGSEFDQYDKLPCRDCHDPHNWEPNSFQAFIRRDLGGKTLTEAIPSTNMSNPLPPGARSRDDARSRQICTTCHAYSDAGTPVRFSDISPAYNNNSSIIKPPDTISQHRSSDTTACTDCHFHNSIGASCRMCHGFPPSDGTQPYYPDTFVPNVYHVAIDSHPKHVGQKSGAPQHSSSVYSFTCSECHYGSAPNNDAGLNYHQNDTLNVKFSPNGVSTKFGVIGNSTYVGETRPEPYYSGGGSCQNVYCHSDGIPSTYQQPRWGLSLGCNGCHGTGTTSGTVEYGMPDYPNGNPKGNSHSIHVSVEKYECSVCHFDTVSGTYVSGRTIKSDVHVNGTVDVVFDGTTASGSYDPATHTCSVSCHGSDTPRWGGTLPNGCLSCHAGTEMPYKPQNDYGTPGTPNPVDVIEYKESGHGRDAASGPYPGSGNPPAGFSNYQVGLTSDCYKCHDPNASHTTKDPTDPFRLGQWAQNIDGLCLDCHGTNPTNPDAATQATGIQTHSESVFGSNANYTWPFTPKCVDCHDPHGDAKGTVYRYYMIRSAVNAPKSASDSTAGSDAYGRPNNTTNLDSITFNSLTGFATGSYAQPGTSTYGICEVCHNQTYTYNRTTDNAGNHVNRTTRCTTCHKHTSGFQGLGGPDIEQYFDGYSSPQNYDDQSHHPLEMSTDGTLTFSGVDNCLSCHGA
ncbi:MAG: CxxxxCH/CxxCH domain-containing protein, partial [Deltaproteobacteria bacterium]